ncbi:hypothetical protein [Streptomyces sp. NPDC003710]
MVRAAVDSLASGRPEAPVVRYPGTIGLQLQSTLFEILLAAGIIATPEYNTMNPEKGALPHQRSPDKEIKLRFDHIEVRMNSLASVPLSALSHLAQRQ